MLDRLNTIDWNSLGNESMPELIRALASNNSQKRHEALDKLLEQLAGELDFSRLTREVVPFVLELLKDETVKDKDQMLFLLWSIATPLDPVGYGIVAQGIPTYLEVLNSADSSVRTRAVQVLCLFSPTEGTIQGIISCIETEHDSPAQAEMIWQLASLEARGHHLSPKMRDSSINLFLALVEYSEHAYVRFVAAITLSRLMKSNTPFQIDSILIDGMIHPEQFPPSPYKWEHDDGWYTVYDALWDVGVERAVQGFMQAINLVQSPFVAHVMAIVLLNLSLGGGPEYISDPKRPFSPLFHESQHERLYYKPEKQPIALQTLTPQQKLVVRAVIENNKIWEIPSNFLVIYGLPASKEETSALLQQ